MKQKKSVLDPFADRLTQWLTPVEEGGDGLTLLQAQQQLDLDGCKISTGRLSEWWQAKQKRIVDGKFFGNLANGSNMAKQVKAAFAENPPPEIETLIGVVQSLIMTLQVKGEANPKYLEMADRLLASVLEFAAMQSRAGFEQLKIQIRQAAEKRMREKLDFEREKLKAAENKIEATKQQVAKLRDVKAPLSDVDRLAIVAKIDEIMGINPPPPGSGAASPEKK